MRLIHGLGIVNWPKLSLHIFVFKLYGCSFHICVFLLRYDYSQLWVIAWFQVIGECHSNQIHDEIAAKYRSINNTLDRDLFVEFCFHTILYQPTSQRFEINIIWSNILITEHIVCLTTISFEDSSFFTAEDVHLDFQLLKPAVLLAKISWKVMCF